MKEVIKLMRKIRDSADEVVEGRSNPGDARTRIAEIRAMLSDCEAELDAENGGPSASSDPPPGGPPDGP